jgi:hypothetical protein
MRIVPIFVTTLNNLDVLVRSCKTYRKLSTKVEIIIHDQGTTDKIMLDYLERLKDNGYSVYHGTNDESSINNSIKEWYKTNDSPFYVVTDYNVSVEGVNIHMLEVCINMLVLMKNSTCVGPALSKLLQPNNQALRINNDIINYSFTEINKTFAVYRKGQEFVMPNTKAIQLAIPYSAILI